MSLADQWDYQRLLESGKDSVETAGDQWRLQYVRLIASAFPGLPCRLYIVALDIKVQSRNVKSWGQDYVKLLDMNLSTK